MFAKIPYWVDRWMNQIFQPHNLKSLLTSPTIGWNNRNNMNNMNDAPGGYSNSSNSSIDNIGYSNIL